jgi:hypothetical protein
LEIRAARSFDIPFSSSASYCFRFLMLGVFFPGMEITSGKGDTQRRCRAFERSPA